MGTRSAIGTPLDNGFEGRYCHWDGYVTGVGKDVFATYRHFADTGSSDPLQATIDYAVRKGADGYWSSYKTPTESPDGGWRDENGDSWVTVDNDWGVEYVYLLTPAGLTILDQGTDDGGHTVTSFGMSGGMPWRAIATVAWDAIDTDWSRVECGADLERCIHIPDWHDRQPANV